MAVLSASAWADSESEVKVSVASEAVPHGLPFRIQVEATGVRVGEPKVPQSGQVAINPDPVARANEISLSMTRQPVQRKVRVYHARATEYGQVTVPPFEVEIDGATIQSEPLSLTVVGVGGPSNRGALFQQDSGPDPGSEQPVAPGGDAVTWGDVVFTEASVDKTSVYQGEPVHLTLALWALDGQDVRVGRYAGARDEYPTTEGFIATDYRPAGQERREVDGLAYNVIQKRSVLYPTRTGRLTIGSWLWEGMASAGTRRGIERREYRFLTDPIHVEVKPLPPGRPAEFSGAVGVYTLEAADVPSRAEQGTPFDIAFTVRGEGNPHGTGAPVFPELENARLVDWDHRSTYENTAERVVTEKHFVYSILPMEGGQLHVPVVRYSYFDPGEEAYITESVGPFDIEIEPAPTQPERVVVGDEEIVREFGGDVWEGGIAPLMSAPGGLRPRPAFTWRAATGAAAPVAAFGLFALAVRSWRARNEDTPVARERRARRACRKALRRVHQAEDPVLALHTAVANYVAGVHGVSPGGMTPQRAREVLGGQEQNAAAAERTARILEACERARYGGGRLGDAEFDALVDAAWGMMDGIAPAQRALEPSDAPAEEAPGR